MAAEPRRRGRRALVALAVVLLVLVGVFVAVDRAAAYVASQKLAGQARTQLTSRDITMAGRPSVVIHGFPFLTQVARGRYGKVNIAARGLVTKDVKIAALDVTATDITAPMGTLLNRRGAVTAANVAGTARIGWDEVARLIETNSTGLSGVSVSAQPDGEVQVRTAVQALGVTADVLASGTVHVSGNVVRVSVNSVQLPSGAVPPLLNPIVNLLKTKLSVNVTIPPLPYNLKISDVHSTVDGIMVSAYARNVVLATH